MWQGCMCGWGHAWLGGVHGRVACVVRGHTLWEHAWQGACMAGGAHEGGMCGGGHAWQGGRGWHRMTDACKNITLPHSFAGGNKCNQPIIN